MHHPTIYNQANAYVKAFIELDMQVKKIDGFDNNVLCIHRNINYVPLRIIRPRKRQNLLIPSRE
jgi:hypothetical protein